MNESRSPRSSPDAPLSRSLPFAALALAAAAVLVQAARMFAVASRGTFANDECFHAFVSEWIATHHSIPTEIPDLYGGLYYYYQPLLHLIGAAFFALSGRTGLHALPVAIWVVTALLLLASARRAIPAEARALATGLFVLNTSLTVFGLLLYVEGLTTLLFTAIALAWIGWRSAPGYRSAIVLGVVIGLGLLAKFTAWLPVAALLAIAGALSATGRRARATELLCAAGIAVLIALPWLVRNQLLFGSALYPAFAPDLDRGLYELAQHRSTLPPSTLLGGLPLTLGVPLSAAVLLAVVAVAARKKWSIGMDLMLAALAFSIAAAFAPMAAHRHLYPFVPMLTLGAAWTLSDALASRRAIIAGATAALLVVTLGVALSRRDLVRIVEPKGSLPAAFAAVKQLVPERTCVLSVWTYDTFYHGGRPATWPIAWGQRRRPLEMFSERDPDRLLALMRRDGIGYVLAPLGAAPQAFDSGNYPASLLTGLETLANRGDVQPVWRSERLVLLRVAPTP